MSERVKHRVNEILANEFRIHESLIVDEARFYGPGESLGFDSLDAVEFIMELEEEFGVDIPDEDAESVRTLAEVYAMIERLTP